MTTDVTGSANELAEERTVLAVKRTIMAADRSLMAWVRTALSMISFGFTIYKILQGFQESGEVVLAHHYTPQAVGLFLTGLGTLSVVLGTIEYAATLREMRQFAQFRLLRPSLVIALIISIAGVFMFMSIVTRLL